MEKQFFTPSGVYDLQQWLYGLTDLALEAEVQEMKANFADWIFLHFQLDERQQNYFFGMDEVVMDFLTSSIVFAVAHRRPIVLSKEGEEEEPIDDKLFKPKNSLMVISHGNGSYEVSGGIDLKVEYIK